MSHKHDIEVDKFYQEMKKSNIRPQPGYHFITARNPSKGTFKYLGKGWLYSVVPVIRVPDASKSTVHLFLTEDKKIFEGKVFHDKKQLESHVNRLLDKKPKYASIGVPVFVELRNLLNSRKVAQSERHLYYNIQCWKQDTDLRIKRICDAKSAYGPIHPGSDPGLNKAFWEIHSR